VRLCVHRGGSTPEVRGKRRGPPVVLRPRLQGQVRARRGELRRLLRSFVLQSTSELAAPGLHPVPSVRSEVCICPEPPSATRPLLPSTYVISVTCCIVPRPPLGTWRASFREKRHRSGERGRRGMRRPPSWNIIVFLYFW